MASKLALSVVIGGAVASSLGSAFKTAESGIARLEHKGSKAKVLKGMIGEAVKLREEWKKAHDSGAASAAGLLRKLESNLDALRKQGVQVGKLDREYQRLGRTARAMDLQVKGQQQLEKGKAGAKSTIGMATAVGAAAAVPTVISAGYQATIRDIAIKAGVANQPEEQAMAKQIIQVSADTGMSRDGVADLVNQLVGAGMDLDKALSYSTVAAKFSVGQGASGVDVASMIQALEQNAKISDPKVMEKTLEGIALQGQAGSFEASDMARWFPVLLASMEKTGSTGPDAVAQLGAMLQVQMKTAGSSDEAANNLKNWIEKIGAGDVVKSYADAGIDYQASLNTGIQKGMSVLESSMALAMQYVQKTDPAKARVMEDAKAKIDKEVDPAKALKALEALEQSLKTGDIFADMQVKAALTAYGQNRGLYEQLKKDAQDANGILDKNLAERRETSAQQWAEVVNATNDAMRNIGDAIRPATDALAQGIIWVARGLTGLSDEFKGVVFGLGVVVAGFAALKGALNALQVARGIANIARGKSLERLADRAGTLTDGVGDALKPRREPVERKPGLLGRLRSAANDSAAEAPAKVSDTQRVFVVNADAIGRTVGGAGGGPESNRRQRRRSRRQARAGGRSGAPRSASRSPTSPAGRAGSPKAMPRPTALVETPSRLGALVKGARAVTKSGKSLPGGNLLDAGIGAIDVALNAETRDEKAEGYGGVAGGLAGSFAGAAVGAAVGSVVPVVGTAIGGLVGAVLGSMGGELGGGWLGKKLFGDDKPEVVASQDEADKATAPGAALVMPAAPKAAPGDVVRSITAESVPPAVLPVIAKAAEVKPERPNVEQSLTFAPNMPVTVQGDVKDPAALARELLPHLRRMFDDLGRQAQARQLSDEPHI